MYLKSWLIVVVVLTFGATAFVCCNKEQDSSKKTKMQVSDYSKMGEIHNAFLTNVKNNFNAVNNINNVGAKIDIIKDFNSNFALELDLPIKEKQLIIQGFEEHKHLVKTEQLVAGIFGQNNLKSGNSEEGNIFDLVESLATDNLINNNSLSILSRLSSDLKTNYEHSLSDAQLKLNIQELITEFDGIGYQSDSGEGEMVATILAISIASIEWWEENPDAYGGNLESANKIAIAPWLAADIAGAILGGVTGAISSYAGTGEVNWTSVGVSAFIGAVTGSTGALGVISRWFR